MKKLKRFLRTLVCVLLLFSLVLPASSQALSSEEVVIKVSELNLLEMNLKLLETINSYQQRDLDKAWSQLIESEAERKKSEESYENLKILLQESEKERKKEIIEVGGIAFVVGIVFGSLVYGLSR